MTIVYCAHCGDAYLGEGRCPHCHADAPSKSSLSGKGIVTALLLGITVLGCEDQTVTSEKIVEIPKEKTEKSEVVIEKNKEQTEQEKQDDRVKEETSEDEIKKAEKPSDNKQESPEKKKEKEVVKAVKKEQKIEGIGSGSKYSMGRPETSVSAKYGVPSYNRPSANDPANTVMNANSVTSLEGTCSVSVLRRTARKYQSQVHRCYNDSLQNNPELSGAITAEVEIESGKVLAVEIIKNETKDSAFGECIRRKIKRWRYPTTCSDVATIPFVFQNK